MRVFGIIGRPLGHSLSKVYFEEKFATFGLADCRFEKFELDDIDALDTVFKRYGDELKGFCVTIPYKKDIMARLDEVSDEAREIGALNCVRVAAGRLSGFNTDAHGFRTGLEKLLGTNDENGGRYLPRALVLGTGGASCAVRYVLEQAGIEYKMVSRRGGPGLLTYEELTPETIDAHRLIVNTTPLGTFPDVKSKPDLPYDAIGPGHRLYDLVYNPPLTAFLAEGQTRGAAILNGETMFRAQAEKNWEIWSS
jgi:shikimate dehydrogenase